MKKYLLTSFYLLVMLAIYHHPITLPNEGTSIPMGQEQMKKSLDTEPYFFGKMAQNAIFHSKKEEKTLQIPIDQNELFKTH